MDADTSGLIRVLLAYLETTGVWSGRRSTRIAYPNSMIATMYLLDLEARGQPGASAAEFEALYRQYYSRATVYRMLKHMESAGAITYEERSKTWHISDVGRKGVEDFLTIMRDRLAARDRGVSV